MHQSDHTTHDTPTGKASRSSRALTASCDNSQVPNVAWGAQRTLSMMDRRFSGRLPLTILFSIFAAVKHRPGWLKQRRRQLVQR